MHITIRHGSEIILDKTLERARAKLLKLVRLLDERKFQSIANVDIIRESASQHSQQLWRASVSIDMAGESFIASERADTPDKAIDRSVSEVKRSIISSRSKHLTMVKKGGGIFKRFTQRFY
ncbi:MAG: hypothetical protein JWL75_645 [Parcubacteria group bacterium]|nr:hypothetical protein [Parcubacteria group bacterium]